MSRANLLPSLFDNLVGTWALSRSLVSANASEPSGKCIGTATFTSRAPSPVIDAEGKLNLADKELLYQERGEFELPVGLKMPFAKSYIWRLKTDHAHSKMSVWFNKPGTELIDYLFHNIDIDFRDNAQQNSHEAVEITEVKGMGGHLCVDDFYSTSYFFQLREGNAEQGEKPQFDLTSFSTVHEVRGPKKEQVITTNFNRPADS